MNASTIIYYPRLCNPNTFPESRKKMDKTISCFAGITPKQNPTDLVGNSTIFDLLFFFIAKNKHFLFFDKFGLNKMYIF